jgi:hypothetical protein
MKYYSTYFGQAYGQGSYGNGSYSCTTQQQQAGTCTTAAGGGTSGTGSSGNGLTNTGIAVATIVTLASLIIFVSLIVRIWRRKPAVQEVTVPDEEVQEPTDQQRDL